MEVILRNRICPNCAEELITNHLESRDKCFNLVLLLDAKLEKCERSIESLENLRDALYGDSPSQLDEAHIIEKLLYYFLFNPKLDDKYTQSSEFFNLTDEDYVSIANLQYPGKYDRCVQVRIIDDVVVYTVIYRLIWECKMVVSKDVILKSDTEYRYKEILEMQNRKDIQIVSIIGAEDVKKTSDMDEKIKSAILSFLRETYERKWLGNCWFPRNQWFKYFLSFLKQHVTLELLDSSINAYVQCCNEILKMPDDASMDVAIKSYKDGKRFIGISEKQIESLRNLIKSRANEHGFDKAIEIIIEHSEYYKRIMAYKKT